MFRRFRAVALTLPLVLAACTPSVDLKQAVEVTDISTGWFDGGIVDGQNRLVPSATFRIRKKDPATDLSTIALNITFKRDGDTENFEDVFVQRVEFGPDHQTAPIPVRAETGYTGDPPQSRADMLKNSHFRDMEVRVLGRQASGQWTELHRFPVERRLITQ